MTLWCKFVGHFSGLTGLAVKHPTWADEIRDCFVLFQVAAYLWLKNWYSSGYPDRCLVMWSKHGDWLAKYQYTVTRWNSMCGYNFCFSMAACKIVWSNPSLWYTLHVGQMLSSREKTNKFWTFSCVKENDNIETVELIFSQTGLLVKMNCCMGFVFPGFPIRMVYLYYIIIMLEIHHSGWEPSICKSCISISLLYDLKEIEASISNIVMTGSFELLRFFFCKLQQIGLVCMCVYDYRQRGRERERERREQMDIFIYTWSCSAFVFLLWRCKY